MPNKRAHVFISGRVQGVFFRYSANIQAKKWGITGWIKNLPDGRVEAISEGLDNDVEKILNWCYQGPEGAVVNNVKIDWQEYLGEFNTFNIQGW